MWYVEDQCNNLDSAIQIITVQDTTLATFDASVIPNDTLVDCDAVPAVPNIAGITATDNCDSPSELTITFAQSNTQTNTRSFIHI